MHRLRTLLDALGGPPVLVGLLLYAGVLLAIAAVAAATVLLRRRRPALAAGAIVLLGGLAAITLVGRGLWVASIGPERLQVLQAMASRPSDFWPRGEGHAPLGPIGAPPQDKAYFEPGGGFSPRAGSFGLSFWVVDPQGRVVTSGDGYRLADTRQAYGPLERPPAIAFSTPAYVGSWEVVAAGTTRLRLQPLSRSGRVELVLRSVGPAGGPLTQVRRVDGRTLLLNGRWRLQGAEPLGVAYIGREHRGWLTATAATSTTATMTASDPGGWLAVRIPMRPGAVNTFVLKDLTVPASIPPDPQTANPGPTLIGADERFAQSLRAQIATLRQAAIGQEIAPGDPLNYPLGWQRDGAYVLVALARAGDLSLARRLAGPFIDRDYFGGFGPEADGPGLSLWALTELSTSLQDPAFDAAIWPAIQRKVALIESLIEAQRPVYADAPGPRVPGLAARPDARLVADPARNGLIVGRMDWQRPVFYVNAASYRGLQGASALALRLGHPEPAQRWSSRADRLQRAYREAFTAPGYAAETRNDRTAISGLWPGEIADPAPFRAVLEARWTSSHVGPRQAPAQRPLWTYFTLAEAHQWLRLGRPDRAWATLDWFWEHQPAPGLYTLWEGAAEENSFGLWKQTRGWVRPNGIAPHYWSAAEMLLLQLAMLAEVEGPPGAERVVIGAGTPGPWLSRPLRFCGVGTAAGPVSWDWDGARVRVWAPLGLAVVLGPGFPSETPLSVYRRSDRTAPAEPCPPLRGAPPPP